MHFELVIIIKLFNLNLWLYTKFNIQIKMLIMHKNRTYTFYKYFHTMFIVKRLNCIRNVE